MRPTTRQLRRRTVLTIAMAGLCAYYSPSAWLFSNTPASVMSFQQEASAKATCGTCHAVPPPDALPRSRWRDQIARMFLIQNNQPEPSGPAGTAARLVKLPPDWESVVAYYEGNAPGQLPPPAAWPAPDRVLPFRKRLLPNAAGSAMHAISNVRLVDLDGDRRLEVVFTDMRSGHVYKAAPHDTSRGPATIGRFANPAHVEPADLDGDGVIDLLVADLGRFTPADHHDGAVIALRGRTDGTFAPVTLDGWPRVSDVEAADFDGDGRADLAVAAFGWRRTGELAVLRNETIGTGAWSFARHPIIARTGAIHAVPADLNRDGKTDIVALFAQEHETVVGFVNQGGMRFEPRIIYSAPHPGWGSSGLQVVDLDKDGNLDVLLTNGDMFDDALVKPYHGIRWLQNVGAFPFAERTLASMAAVHRAQAADLDGDGDLDVVACALVPAEGEPAQRPPALVWLEQRGPGIFERHVIDGGLPAHATLDVGDIDGDGDIDIVVGNFAIGRPLPGPIEIFENLRTSKQDAQE